MANYIEDSDLMFEIILSKGKGYLTENAKKYLILISENIIRKKDKNYKDSSDRSDCLQEGLLHLFSNWMSFNEKKASKALPYFTEVFKRGMTNGLNQIYNKKTYQQEKTRMISLDSSNEGKGLYNI